jgi:hypothetical protein
LSGLKRLRTDKEAGLSNNTYSWLEVTDGDTNDTELNDKVVEALMKYLKVQEQDEICRYLQRSKA